MKATDTIAILGIIDVDDFELNYNHYMDLFEYIRDTEYGDFRKKIKYETHEKVVMLYITKAGDGLNKMNYSTEVFKKLLGD